jgi:hypothetical protein
MKHGQSRRRKRRSASALAILGLCTALLGGCTSSKVPHGDGDHREADLLKRVGVLTVNYTDFEIAAVLIESSSGKRIGISGPIAPRVLGGVGPATCCYSFPRPGEEIKIWWQSPSMRATKQVIQRTAILTGQAPADSNQFAHLIIRFMDDFPAATIQAEFISDDELRAGRASTVIDPLLWPVLDQLTTK